MISTILLYYMKNRIIKIILLALINNNPLIGVTYFLSVQIFLPQIFQIKSRDAINFILA